MGFNIIIKPIVWFDLEEAIFWYEQESKASGNLFFDSFEITINKIQLNPKAYSTITGDVRRHLIKNFFFKIFYTITADPFYILGVSYAKRSDAFVKRRLKLL